MTSRLRGLAVLGVLVGISAGSLSVILDRQEPALPPIEPVDLAAGQGRELVLPDVPPAAIRDLVAALEYPLFSRTRQPPPDAPEPVIAPAAEHVDAKLAGVLTTGAEKVAILFSRGSRNAQRLREGDLFQGWRVVEIDDASVRLERDGKTDVLVLDYTGEPLAPK
jgi:general secretion pathway protein N